MKKIVLKASLAFVRYSAADLAEFGGNTGTCLTGSKVFTNPPVSAEDILSQSGELTQANQAALKGGVQLTAVKNAKRAILIESLRLNAYYVQTVANNDLEVLLSSGYFATSSSRTSSPLDKPGIMTIENEVSTQLLVRLTPILNARSYQLQVSSPASNGAWQDGGVHMQARRIMINGLTPGVVYTVRARAIGGSTGQSDWSDPQSHICT